MLGVGELAARLAVRALGNGATVTGTGGDRPPERWPEGATWLPSADGRVPAPPAGADAVVVLGEAAGDGAGPSRGRAALEMLSGTPDCCRRLVYWGPHRVYGAPSDPRQPRSERAPLVEGGAFREWAELDRRVCALGQHRPGLEVVQFRAVPVLGHGMREWLHELDALPLVLVPRAPAPVQVLHADDAVDILWHACTIGHGGVYNAASDGLLFRARVARALGRVPLPVPRAVAALLLAPGRLIGRPAALGVALAEAYAPLVLDNARLKTHFGCRPRRSARTALLEAARGG